MYKLDAASDFRVVSYAPKTDMESKQQKQDKKTNELLWTITALHFEEEGARPELVNATLASNVEPDFTPMFAQLEGVKIGYWAVGDKSGVYFQAAGIVELEEAA